MKIIVAIGCDNYSNEKHVMLYGKQFPVVKVKLLRSKMMGKKNLSVCAQSIGCAH